jgi:hypothetical protein
MSQAQKDLWIGAVNYILGYNDRNFHSYLSVQWGTKFKVDHWLPASDLFTANTEYSYHPQKTFGDQQALNDDDGNRLFGTSNVQEAMWSLEWSRESFAWSHK